MNVALDPKLIKTVPRPERWDEPLGMMTELDVDRVLGHPMFAGVDPGAFPLSTPLRDLVRNDARIVAFEPGDIIVRQGDYGNSAFFILSGHARVSVSTNGRGVPPRLLGRGRTPRRSLLKALKPIFGAISEFSEVRHRHRASLSDAMAELGERQVAGDEVRVYLQDVEEVIGAYETDRISKGESFGEIAAISRTARTATVFAETEMCVVEIRWQGLRDLTANAPVLKAQLDERYRRNSLITHLRELALFGHLVDEELRTIAEQTKFQTFGSFRWYSEFNGKRSMSLSERLAIEPLIVEEGDYPNDLVLVRNGFGRVTQRYGQGQRTTKYLGTGHSFGLNEIYANWQAGRQYPYERSLYALGYVDLLFVPALVVEQAVLPRVDEATLQRLMARESSGDTSNLARTKPRQRALSSTEGRPGAGVIPGILDILGMLHRARSAGDDAALAGDELLEQLVEQRFVNGTATMLIDLERCTRCDECVRACADAHDGNPRFIRHGPEVGRFMVANACMHCTDPVCLIGCPTGAIHRATADGQVVINDQTCIGCATCASSCPYQNIRMVEIRDGAGARMHDEKSGLAVMKATKCDLCVEQMVSPACEYACPHDALRRIDLSNPGTIREWAEG
jgi:Fe-S-cluster-containing dehydrogenase component/CRP-like cAMP-binding protein